MSSLTTYWLQDHPRLHGTLFQQQQHLKTAFPEISPLFINRSILEKVPLPLSSGGLHQLALQVYAEGQRSLCALWFTRFLLRNKDATGHSITTVTFSWCQSMSIIQEQPCQMTTVPDGSLEGGPLSALVRQMDRNVGTEHHWMEYRDCAFLLSSPLQNTAKNDCFSRTRGFSQGKN